MWQDNFPCKLGRVFVLQLGSITTRVCKWALGFLSEKIQKRVAIVGKKKFCLMESEIPTSVLPTSLGGNVDMEAAWPLWVRARLEAALPAAEGAPPPQEHRGCVPR